MRSISLGALFILLASFLVATEAFATDGVIRACAHKQTGLLRFSPLGTCRPSELPLEWNVQGPPAGSVVFLRSNGAVTAVAEGPSVEIPGLSVTLPVGEGARLWVQGDFHEHRFCQGYRDRSHVTSSWALDLELDGVVVASREMRGDQGNLANHESKPFTWVSEPLVAGDHSVRFLLRPPETDTVATPPNQAKVCLGTDGSDERQSRVVLLELPG